MASNMKVNELNKEEIGNSFLVTMKLTLSEINGDEYIFDTINFGIMVLPEEEIMILKRFKQ